LYEIYECYALYFYLNLWLNMLLNIKILFCKYPQVLMDIKKICGYPHNGYPHEYGYKYGTNIYPTGRVRGSYYPYPTHLVDIHGDGPWSTKLEGR